WFTANTTYQTEKSQGSLEPLLNCRTLLSGLTCLPLADALDRVGADQLADDGRAVRADGHEEAELPRDDLAEEAKGAQALAHRVGEAGEFDAIGAHDAHATELEAFGEIEDCLALDERGIGMVGGQVRRSDCRGVGDPCGRHAAADDPFPVIGLEPIDTARLVGQPLPDRQQQASD
ncbi:hypothetical protein, partial [Pseudomonas sp. JAI120]|uniref:hypothetical protein n=1 Tax=Pseudomonas sp. JAI120 TaxID=2723063 RepID=UPI00403F0E16